MSEPLFPAQSPQYLTVLVVDDDPDILNLVGLVLNRESYKVVTANNAEEAYAELNNNAIDIVICDIMMPAVNGLEFVERIRTEDDFSTIPVIMLTSCSDEFELPAIVSGADVFCEKSRLRKDLVKQIELLIN